MNGQEADELRRAIRALDEATSAEREAAELAGDIEKHLMKALTAARIQRARNDKNLETKRKEVRCGSQEIAGLVATARANTETLNALFRKYGHSDSEVNALDHVMHELVRKQTSAIEFYCSGETDALPMYVDQSIAWQSDASIWDVAKCIEGYLDLDEPLNVFERQGALRMQIGTRIALREQPRA